MLGVCLFFWCSQIVTVSPDPCHFYLLINDVVEICTTPPAWAFTNRYAFVCNCSLSSVAYKGSSPARAKNQQNPTLLLSFLPAVRSGCSLALLIIWTLLKSGSPCLSSRIWCEPQSFSPSDLPAFPRLLIYDFFPFLEAVFLHSHKYILVDTLGIY